MRNPLLREITVMLLAAVPMLLLVLACQAGHRAEPLDAAADVASALPGQADTAPLLAGAAVDEIAGAMAKARLLNAADRFATGPVAAAAPFRFSGTVGDFARARDCLALAALAEAGASDAGQRAVIQVVLNRVRHPAFARTICGTVFQGAERRTGCQFTFTCDGALARRYTEAAWRAARGHAERALQGDVFAPVGTATHYHTDWVYPAWSPQLVKIAQVESHLFFRWPGFWGSGAAARIRYRGSEPVLERLTGAALPAMQDSALREESRPLPADTPAVSSGSVMLRDPSGKANFLLLVPGQSPAAALASARQLCNRGGTCRVYGWLDPAAVPQALPLSRNARAALQFSYARDPSGAEITLYNCATFPAAAALGQTRDQCMPRAR